MPRLFRFCLLLTLLNLAGCYSPPKFENFDPEGWQRDRRACQGTRTKLIPVVEGFRPQLIGLREPAIWKLLGRPDKVEIAEQTQQIYLYYLTPAPACGNAASGKARLLSIRFNALSKVTETLLLEE